MTDQISAPWPPPYKIRKHKRAKHVKLRASHLHGLVITTPARFNLTAIPSILEEHKSWIETQLARLPVRQPDILPRSIVFHAQGETWQVDTLECQAKLEIIVRPAREIVFVGNIHNRTLCKRKLLAWVKSRAADYLLAALQDISTLTSLTFDSLTLRDQKTIWGSCTSKKAISLNYKLIFLPHHLMRYVIIHELCHTKYLNHSAAFWDHVALFDPAWRSHRRELRQANHYIPDWIV